MHLNSELIFKKYSSKYFKQNLKVLEIGPTGVPSAYSKMVNNDTIEWHTIDFEDTTFINSSTTKLTYIINSPYKFPIENNTYDIVLSGQVIEHVQDIWTWLVELKRITKNNGIIFIISPISWPYHEAPIDCWRIFPSGYEALADKLNIELEFCTYESLELEKLQGYTKNIRTIPGKSYNYENSKQKVKIILMWNAVISKIPVLKKYLLIPIEVSYDAIAIFRKNEVL